MAEATVTLKLSPTEFDLVREALTFTHVEVLKATSSTKTSDAAERQKLRAKALRLNDLSGKLGGGHG